MSVQSSAQGRYADPLVHLHTLAEKPAWLKSAKHRTEIVRTIGRLRASLPR